MGIKIKTLLIILFVVPLLGRINVFAQSSSSYRVEETQFGTGGDVNMNSPAYNAQGFGGSTGVGSSSSTNYDAESGFLTPSEPFLEFVVETSSVDLGTLTPTTTGTGTSTFYVRTYLSGEYVVITMSSPPTSENGTQLTPLASGGASTVGSNQFGINLVDNSSPNIGANPDNIPDSTFADGGAATGYGTVNQFRYNVGDVIARAAVTSGRQAVGRTNYTVSYIANVSGVSTAGTYQMIHDMVVVATY